MTSAVESMLQVTSWWRDCRVVRSYNRQWDDQSLIADSRVTYHFTSCNAALWLQSSPWGRRITLKPSISDGYHLIYTYDETITDDKNGFWLILLENVILENVFPSQHCAGTYVKYISIETMVSMGKVAFCESEGSVTIVRNYLAAGRTKCLEVRVSWAISKIREYPPPPSLHHVRYNAKVCSRCLRNR